MQTLCVNCDNQPSCLWKNGRVILCNEHLVSAALEEITLPIQPKKEQHNVQSLCDSCVHSNTCSFRSKELKTIFCEEYE